MHGQTIKSFKTQLNCITPAYWTKYMIHPRSCNALNRACKKNLNQRPQTINQITCNSLIFPRCSSLSLSLLFYGREEARFKTVEIQENLWHKLYHCYCQMIHFPFSLEHIVQGIAELFSSNDHHQLAKYPYAFH